jgi:hypothetical protein
MESVFNAMIDEILGEFEGHPNFAEAFNEIQREFQATTEACFSSCQISFED